LARTYVESYLSQVAYHNRGDLDDLMQDLYLEARKSFHKYSGVSKFTTWLVKIGINTNLQRLKKKRLWNSKFVSADEFNESILEMADRFSMNEINEKENEIEYPENSITIIENCINELTDVQRKHLELFMEGKSHAEMAEMLSITPEYSKTRLRIIRQQLAAKIEPKLKVKIKSYTNSTETINRTAHKKTYHEKYLKKNK
jgi:RNA polymerase sigma-70 factor (ECF subfamily)